MELEYTYNLNVVKEMKVTDSFLTLSKDVRQCQNDATFAECRTSRYFQALLAECKCLPFNLKLTNQVIYICIEENLLNIFMKHTINFCTGTIVYFRAAKMCEKYFYKQFLVQQKMFWFFGIKFQQK